MEPIDAEQELVFIKKTMERAGRYTNIPTAGYLAAGLLGLAGVGATYWRLGPEKAGRLRPLPSAEGWTLGAIWLAVLLLAGLGAWAATLREARRNATAPWDALAARLFLSQIPQLLAAGLLTLALARAGAYQLVPALWLLHYGVIAFSFSYFTGREHRIQSLWFLGLGALALFGPDAWALPLLGLGFGGGHLLFAVLRRLRSRTP